jgi:hypothetical protein
VNDILNNEVNLLIVAETNGYYHHFQIVTAKSVSYGNNRGKHPLM